MSETEAEDMRARLLQALNEARADDDGTRVARADLPHRTTYAIRHPDRGKAHREDSVWHWMPVCGAPSLSHVAIKRVPLADVPPKDLCKRCWPEAGAE